MKLLVVEDHSALRALLSDNLTEHGFSIDVAATTKEALALLQLVEYDLVILDLGLPDGDGMSVLKQLRNTLGFKNPCLIISARDALQSKIAGLDAGADDYLIKPFEFAELHARLRALLRRPKELSGSVVEVANLCLCKVKKLAFVDGSPIQLARREYLLLSELVNHVGWVVIKNQLEDRLYGFNENSSPNAVEALVSRVRRKLAKEGANCQIETVRGLGYKIAIRDNPACC